MTDTAPRPDDEAPEEIVPDYSRLGFRDLQKLCKARGIAGDGNSIALVEKLKAWDAEHGKEVDISALGDSDPDVDILDLDDEPAEPATPESPPGAGEAASASAPGGVRADGVQDQNANANISVPPGGSVTSAAPAIVVVSAPDQPKGLPQGTYRGGRVDLTVKTGLVKIGEGHGAAEARAYRMEFPIGMREISDSDHFMFIAETHAAAHAAGHATKGGTTIGERVGYSADANGARTAVYQVSLKRQQ